MLAEVDGVLTATATIAAMGDPSAFKSGREFAAWLGLVPRHRGTGRRAVNLHQHGKSQYRNRTRLQSLLNRAYARRW